MKKKRCGKCHRRKPLDKFYRHRGSKDGLQSYCNSCNAAWIRFYWRNNKNQHRATKRAQKDFVNQKILDYLLTHPCIDCGEKDPIVLDFDHVRGKKTLAISTMVAKGFAWPPIEEEIKKCDSRCANCHRRKTARENGNGKLALLQGGREAMRSAVTGE